jgi:N-acyl-D-amino-acid deacylase
MGKNMLDVLIENGWVVDGTGNPSRPADVGIVGDRIVDVGHLEGASAQSVIDATGKIVCPGFVDPHSHSDWSVLGNPTLESTIRQGVTTEIVGNCGEGLAPVTAASRAAITGRLRLYGYDGPVAWKTFGSYLEAIGSVGMSGNLAWLVGHNTIRAAAGASGPEATSAQLVAMESMVDEAMEAGALGFSTGLEYGAGREAGTDELVALAAVAGRRGGYYASHIRNRDAALQPAVDEFVEIVRQSGTRGEISHLNVRYDNGAKPGAWNRAVETIENARHGGLDILADATPFTSGDGMMAGILPHWLLRDGAEAAAERLSDPEVRRLVRADADRYWRFVSRGQWDRVRLLTSADYPDLNGLPLPEIARRRDQEPWDSYFDILQASGAQLESMTWIGELFTEAHATECVTHPLFNLGVDCFSSRTDGPLSSQTQHPLYFAGHVYYLAHYARERGVIRLEDLIRKMTSMPATHFGLSDRGVIRVGAAADVVVLDYRTVGPGSTIERPLVYAHGVEQVFVNGVPVVRDGEHTGARPGRHLLRP